MGAKNKMRNLVATQATNNSNNATATTGAAQPGLIAGGKFASSLIPNVGSGPGGTTPLSQYGASEYATNADQIAKTYADQRQLAGRALGASGFGSSPGAIASTINTAGRNQAADTSMAYNNAMTGDVSRGLEGVQTAEGIGGLGLNQSGTSTGQAQQRVGMGSTMGDVMSGVGDIASLFASPFTGGASAAGGFANIMKGLGNKGGPAGNKPSGGFNNIAPSGIGAYSPTYG